MSEDKWELRANKELIRSCIDYIESHIKKVKFADRVQMIHKLLKLIVETLDGMEAEAARECP